VTGAQLLDDACFPLHPHSLIQPAPDWWPSPYLFPNDEGSLGHQASFKKVLGDRVAGGRRSSFSADDLCSTYATPLRAGGVADEWVTQLLRQGDATVFKKYSQMKLQMRRKPSQSSTGRRMSPACVLTQR